METDGRTEMENWIDEQTDCSRYKKQFRRVLTSALSQWIFVYLMKTKLEEFDESSTKSLL